ncbi:MAG TPA: hypothetical protein VI603_02495 [Saprospiraceae bacterium]|nr:hypothetical protein [Saprospiraceae bacterium]
MTYTERHLEQIDAELSRTGRNGDPPKLSPQDSTDPALKAAFQDVEMVWQATRLEKLQGKLEMLKEYEEEIQAKAKAELEAEAEEEPKLKVVTMQNRKWILSIAAGVALLVVAGWLIFRPQEPLAIQHAYLTEHFDDYVLHDVMKGVGSSEYTPEQLRAYNLFAIKDFKKAIPLLKKEWEENGDTLSLFYLWVSYKAVGNKENAEKYQKDVLAIKSTETQKLVQTLLE